MATRTTLHNTILVLVLLSIASCAMQPGRAQARRAAQSAPGGRFSETLTVDGRTRTYTLVLPDNANAAAPVPLIIALHGGGGSGAQFETSSLLTPKAHTAGYAVVYPDGTADGPLGLRTWNGGNCCGSAVSSAVDDVKFISQMLDSLIARHRIDARRVYATGHSNGAIMSYRLACDLSGRIAAIAPNAGLHEQAVCAPGRPVPVLHMHSKLDMNVPYLGGVGSGLSGVDFPSLDEVMARWVALDQCAAQPQQTVVANRYTTVTWTGCAAGATVSYVLTEDGGHSWPGGEAGRPGGDPPSTAINANDLALAFFAQHVLPAPRSLWLPSLTRAPPAT